MLNLRQISSIEDPAVATYRTMRRPAEHAAQGIFIAEGEKVVRRLLQDPRQKVLSVLLPTKWLADYEPLLRARPENLDVFIAEKDVLESLVGFHLYQGVLAVGKIPPPPTLDHILATSPHPRLFVAADGLTNAENVGALVRNCAAFGVQGLIIGETCATPWLRRAVRSSMGTIFQLPVIHTANMRLSLRRLRDAGLRVIAAHPHAEGRTLTQGEFTEDCCIVMGSEGAGIGPEILEVCDDAVAIRMTPTVDSLNVTSATSVFLYEACRQRGRM
jgi:tRNA G18 (ribose-2'-O)-methylase SpoU